MATAAPHSTRHKTLVVRSTVVHLVDEKKYAGGFWGGDKFCEPTTPSVIAVAMLTGMTSVWKAFVVNWIIKCT